MIIDLAAGFVLGWVGSMPLAGAVSIFVFQRGLTGRVGRGLSLACGAAVAEAAWCLVALIGADQILQRWPHLEGITRIVGGVILVALGFYFLLKRNVLDSKDPRLAAEPDVPDHASLRKEFWLGFTLVAGNISIPFNWLALIAVLISRDYDPATGSHALFILGVTVGIVGWFALLLRILSRLRQRFRPGSLTLILRLMGGLLVVVGVVAFFRSG